MFAANAFEPDDDKAKMAGLRNLMDVYAEAGAEKALAERGAGCRFSIDPVYLTPDEISQYATMIHDGVIDPESSFYTFCPLCYGVPSLAEIYEDEAGVSRYERTGVSAWEDIDWLRALLTALLMQNVTGSTEECRTDACAACSGEVTLAASVVAHAALADDEDFVLEWCDMPQLADAMGAVVYRGWLQSTLEEHWTDTIGMLYRKFPIDTYAGPEKCDSD